MAKTPAQPSLSRRQVFAAASAAGAVATVAAVAPALRTEAGAEQPDARPDKGGGYRVTQHVLRYYQTARV